jgi:hypothetical protein
MKRQNKLNIKVRDLEPLKDVIGGRRLRKARGRAGTFGDLDLRGEYKGGLGFGHRSIQ